LWTGKKTSIVGLILGIILFSSILTANASATDTIKQLQDFTNKKTVKTPKQKILSIKTECDSNTLKGKITNQDVDFAKIFILNSVGSIVDTKEAKNGEFFVKNFNQYKKVKISADGFDTLIQDLKCDSKIVKKDTKSKDVRSITKAYPRIMIIGMLEGNMPNQYIVGFDICAGSDRLEKPQLAIITDIQTFKPVTFPAIIGSNSCITYDYTVKANDPKSINIGFYKTDDSEKITKLEKELAELKKMIKDSQK